jgi:hypothetical protein
VAIEGDKRTGGPSPLAKSGETVSGTGYLVPQSFVAGGNRVVSRFVGLQSAARGTQGTRPRQIASVRVPCSVVWGRVQGVVVNYVMQEGSLWGNLSIARGASMSKPL